MPNTYDNDIYSTSAVQSTNIFNPGDEAWRINDDSICQGVFSSSNIDGQPTETEVVKFFVPFAADMSGLDWNHAIQICNDPSNIAYTKTRQAATACVRAYRDKHTEKATESEKTDGDNRRTWSEEELLELIAAFSDPNYKEKQLLMIQSCLPKSKFTNPKHKLPVQTPQDVREFSKAIEITTHVVARAIANYVAEKLNIRENIDCSIKTDANGFWYAAVTIVPTQGVSCRQNIMLLFATERGYALVPSTYGSSAGTCVIEQKQCEKIITELTGLRIVKSVKPVNTQNILFLCR